MTYAVIAVPWLLVLVLLTALVQGQPAAAEAQRTQINGQSTEVAWLRATVYAIPTPTARRGSACNPSPYFNC